MQLKTLVVLAKHIKSCDAKERAYLFHVTLGKRKRPVDRSWGFCLSTLDNNYGVCVLSWNRKKLEANQNQYDVARKEP